MLAMRFSKFVCEQLSELKGMYGAPAPGLTSADIEMNFVGVRRRRGQRPEALVVVHARFRQAARYVRGEPANAAIIP
jgi:hypothetical protein